MQNEVHFQSWYNNSSFKFKHSFNGTTIFIEPNKVFTPKTQEEENAIKHFAGSKSSCFDGKSVMTFVGEGRTISISGEDIYQDKIKNLEAENAKLKEANAYLTRELSDANDNIVALKMIQINKSDKKNIQKQTKDGDISAENTVENPVINN